jgi:hypothetical protein
MRTSKILLTALTAALVLGAAVSTASARRLETSNQSYLVNWPSLELVARDLFGVSHTVKCPVTLDGSFHSRTLSKVSGQLVGYITTAEVNNAACTGGHATVLRTTLPWHVRYDSFTGSLPSINGIRVQLIGAAFLVEIPPISTCLYRSTTESPAFGIINRDVETSVGRTLTADSTANIPLDTTVPHSSGCPTSGRFQGTGEVFLQADWRTRITVRLVQ